MIRVFLADDHTIVREGLKRLVDETSGMTLAGQTDRGQAVLDRAGDGLWDVLILDLSLEDVSGIEVMRRLGQAHPRLAVVVLSMYPESPYAVRLLKMGAKSYLTKGCSSEELVAAIRAAASGQRYLTRSVSDLLVETLGGGGDPSQPPHERLSPRQHQVFMLVVEGRSSGEIAVELTLSPSTVSTHLAHIRERLGVRTNGEMIQYAYRAGLVAEPRGAATEESRKSR